MPGFGSYYFGSGPFGEWPWAKNVLYFLLPELDREFDQDNEYLLEKLMAGYAPQYDRVRRQIRNFTDLVDPLKVRSQYDDVTTIRLGVEIVPRGVLEQRGVDATVNSLQELVAPTGRFRFDDVGKELTITGSAVATNNTRVRIAKIVTPSKILTEPLLSADTTLMTWELRPYVAVDPSFHTFKIQSGDISNILKGWVLFDGATEYQIVGRRHFNWKDPTATVFVEQEGTDGIIDSSGYLVTSTGSFSAQDIGKRIVISGGSELANEGVYEIASIVSGGPPWVVELVESASLVQDVTPAYWAVRPQAEIDVEAFDIPRGVVEQQGLSCTVTPASTLTLLGAKLDASNVGQVVSISGSTLGYNGVHEIVSVTSLDTCVVTTVFVGAVETNLVWEIRTRTGLGDSTQSQVYAPSILAELAKNFGIESDPREDEKTQRSWVKHISRLINIKGLPEAYETMGALTGLIVTTTHLWRVTQEVYLGLASAYPYVVEAGESATGRSGTNGRLSFSGGVVHFHSTTALFKSSDVGRHIRASNAADAGNNKLYTIAQYISPTEVSFRVALDAASTPEYGVAGSLATPTLRWGIVRLYATKPPKRPRFDDFNSDLLEEIIDGNPPTQDLFSIDRYCWEPDFVPEVPFNFVSVVPSVANTWTVTVATPGGQAGSAEVILQVGNWVLVDANGVEYFVESVPVAAGPPNQWSFSVFGTLAPSMVGAVSPYFVYECDVLPSCDYCGSNKILVTITLGPDLAAQTGLAVENILQRALERIEQIKPAHVELVIRFVQSVSATLTLTANIEAHPAIYASLIVLMSPLYDALPGDDFVTDDGLMASLDIVVTP